MLRTQIVTDKTSAAPIAISLAAYMPTPKQTNVATQKSEVKQKETPLPKKRQEPQRKKEVLKQSAPTPQQMSQSQPSTVPSTEAFTPQISKEEPLVNNEQKPDNSPQEPLMPLPKEQNTPQVHSAIEPTLLGVIRSMIQESLRYPSLAKRLKLEGVVVVSFVLTRDGRVESAKVLQKSGSSSLDSRALETVVALSGAYPHLENEVTLQIPIAFSIKKS